jgi:uncharacterized phage protein (TIGR02220 family)
MAEGKKSFIAYSDWYGMFKALPDEVAGKLIKHIFSYVNDENPTTEDFVINALFEQVKSTLKRDLKKWEEQQEQRKQAGIRSAEVRRQNATLVNARSISSTDNVSVSVSDNVINKEQPKVDWDLLLSAFNDLTKRNFKLIPEKAKRQILARLKEGYTKADLWNAIENCYNDEYHKETNHKYLTLEFISRPDKMEKYSVDVVKTKKIDKSKIGML